MSYLRVLILCIYELYLATVKGSTIITKSSKQSESKKGIGIYIWMVSAAIPNLISSGHLQRSLDSAMRMVQVMAAIQCKYP